MIKMKKFLSIVAILLSGLILVLSLAGIAGVWVGHTYVNRALNDIFDVAGQARLETSTRIDEMIARREDLRRGLDDLSGQITSAAQQVEANPVVFEAIDQLMEGRLAPALTEADAAGRKLYADLAGLDAAVTAMNSTFLFRNQEGALDELSAFLGSLLDDLQQLDSDFRRLESALRRRKSETVQALAGSLQSIVGKLDAQIAETQSRLGAVQARLDSLQTDMDAGRAHLLNLITWLAVILTAVLAWLAISQVLAARYAWQVYRQPSAGSQIEAVSSGQAEGDA